MPNEEKKPDTVPAPASGENTEVETLVTPEIPETPETPKTTETPDYKAESEKKDKELKEKVDQLNKAGFTIQKLKERMKEEGIELEPGQSLSEEQIGNIVSKIVEEKVGPISQENQDLKIQLSEVLKTISSKENKSSGGGEGGQKPPKEEGTPRPEMTDDEEETVKGMEWDSKKAGWVDPATKKFYPHKRHTTSPKEEE